MIFSISRFLQKYTLKVAKIISIHKRDSQPECSKCRPIALLLNIDKILEKLMDKALSNFLDKNELIYSLRFWFRQNYSTSYILIHLTITIKQSLDRDLFSCDISTHCAFDKVDHDILLGKLEHYRIRRITNKWLETYLKDRQQFVLVNGYNLQWVSM